MAEKQPDMFNLSFIKDGLTSLLNMLANMTDRINHLIKLKEFPRKIGAFDSEMLTTADNVQSLTADKRENKIKAIITVLDNAISYTLAGENPTTAYGHVIYNNITFELSNQQEINRFQFTNLTAGAQARIMVSYYGEMI
jgi:hypothetical protein